LRMAIVCDAQRLEFLTQIVVAVEASERNAVAISQVVEWDVLLLTLVNRSRSSFSESSFSLFAPSSSSSPSIDDDEKIVVRISHRIVSAVACAHLNVTCGWKIICGCLDLACRLIVGQPEKSAGETHGLPPGMSSMNRGSIGQMDGLTFVLGCLIRQVRETQLIIFFLAGWSLSIECWVSLFCADEIGCSCATALGDRKPDTGQFCRGKFEECEYRFFIGLICFILRL
jgi:hypothetical protein